MEYRAILLTKKERDSLAKLAEFVRFSVSQSVIEALDGAIQRWDRAEGKIVERTATYEEIQEELAKGVERGPSYSEVQNELAKGVKEHES